MENKKRVIPNKPTTQAKIKVEASQNRSHGRTQRFYNGSKWAHGRWKYAIHEEHTYCSRHLEDAVIEQTKRERRNGKEKSPRN